VKYPQYLANLVEDFAKKHHLKTTVLDEKDMKKEGLGLILAVGQGAVHQPRLIIAEYHGDPKSKERIALVGKGIVFDSGGMNLKPTGYIEDMKTDMAGAATCFGAFKSAVELKLKKNVILVMCCAENAISNTAFKPGDMFIAYNGLGVEITNTDAEGRLVLADGLAYVQKNFKATTIIDLATLTGACMVALGFTTAGLFCNDKKLRDDLIETGEETGERIWELPVFDEHRESMKSKVADLKNSEAKGYGGASKAAAFMEKFIEENTKWAHLDIAGPAEGKKDEYYVPELGTGRYLRTLVEFLRK
jgi:leucyl aminopeptidase